MSQICVGGTAAAEKRFIATSSGVQVTIVEETDRYIASERRNVLQSTRACTTSVKGAVHIVFSYRHTRIVALSSNWSTTPSTTTAVVAMTVSCEGRLLAVCTSEKHLVMWESDQWRVRGER